jgi:hypothetical protein
MEGLPLEKREVVVETGFHVLQRVHRGEEIEQTGKIVNVQFADSLGLLLGTDQVGDMFRVVAE